MRVVIVGPSAERARVRVLLPDGVEAVGEAETMEAARDLGATPDAWLVVVPEESRETGLQEPLTPRELEVIELLAQGLPNKSIAARLGISDQTVKYHVASICGKLGAANRTEAARLALRSGIIPL